MSTTATIMMPVGAAAAPDGTASNLAPAITRRKASGSAPAPYWLEAAYDAAADEWLSWSFNMPTDYASGLVCKGIFKMASATSGNVVNDARLQVITPGDAEDADAGTFSSSNAATTAVAATAGYLTAFSITMTNADSVAAGDACWLYFSRTGSSGSDTASGDQELVLLWLEYTTT